MVQTVKKDPLSRLVSTNIKSRFHMNLDAIRRIPKDYLILIPILALAFYMAFIPHLNYPYPVHIDEWDHICHTNALLEAGDVVHLDPYTGQAISGLVAVMEAGFHLLFGVFRAISGISFLDIFRYLPSFIFVFTVLSVFIFTRRQGFGWESALFTTLIISTVGIMGPAFLVPVSFGLLFVPLSLFVVFNVRTPWAYVVLFLFICFVASMHPPSAICCVLIIAPSILLGLRGDLRHNLGLGLALVIPFLVTLPWTHNLILSTGKLLFFAQPLPRCRACPGRLGDEG